jgi:S-adenosylmethionine:tRNA ribosyltransferase-isomerase
MNFDPGSNQGKQARGVFSLWWGGQAVDNRREPLAVNPRGKLCQAPLGPAGVQFGNAQGNLDWRHAVCPIPLQFDCQEAYTPLWREGKVQMPELAKYDYDLPKDLIAQSPVACRSDARLLVVDRGRKSLEHKHIRDLPEILRQNDCLVINDTRVVPARLVGRRHTTGGHWEGLFLEASPDGLWRLLCKTRGKLRPGDTITLINAVGDEDVRLELAVKEADGTWIARPLAAEDAYALLDRVGRVPLPPYIRRGKMVDSDRQQYQTVYAQVPGAVAAPTAGLHFTTTLLQRLVEQGVELCALTLHIGPGTFRPIASDTLAQHHMHTEWGRLKQESVDRILACRRRGGRVVAVGTTAVRLLETAATDGQLKPFAGYTGLFIRPPYKFRIVDALLTNFHLPRTTLLVLVRTFGGDELIRRAYDEAIREQYRFYSYGDAMLII